MLLGNMGRPGGGVNAERGHANIQGNTDNAISWEIFPGYLAVPKPGMSTMADYLSKVPSKPTQPNAVNYFGTNYKKFLVSLLKAWYGDAAQPDNDFRYGWLPKPAKNSSWLTIHDEARSGNPRRPVRRRHVGCEHRARLEADERVAGQPEVAGGHGPVPDGHLGVLAPAGARRQERSRPRCSSSPARTGSRRTAASSTPAAGRSGSGRCSTPPVEVKDDNWILAQLFLRLKALYAKEGGTLPEPILNLKWSYSNPATRRSTRSPRRSTGSTSPPASGWRASPP